MSFFLTWNERMSSTLGPKMDGSDNELQIQQARAQDSARPICTKTLACSPLCESLALLTMVINVRCTTQSQLGLKLGATVDQGTLQYGMSSDFMEASGGCGEHVIERVYGSERNVPQNK